MSFATGRYGVEYNPREDGEKPSPATRCLVALVVAAAAVSLSATVVRRVRARVAADPVPSASAEPSAPSAPHGYAHSDSSAPAPPVQSAPSPVAAAAGGIERRPPKVRSLLLRLEKAEESEDVEMAVSTIEQIRAQPGLPAADIDDRLARRLGDLNMKWLFGLGNAQWVSEVKVKPGDSATRIARENASTLASLRRLNPGVDVERLRAGAVLKVMKRPRFNLIVHSRARTADLQLNGKFFRRYDLRSEVEGRPGTFESSGNLRQLLSENGIRFTAQDSAELELLMPRGSSVTISDL